MERPIIVSANGLSADTVRSFGAGLAVEPGNPYALAQAIRSLRANPALRQRCVVGCRDLARAHDRDVLAKLMLSEIRAASEMRSPARRRWRRRAPPSGGQGEIPQAGNF